MHLFPDLRSGRLLMRLGIGGVRELVDVERARGLPGDSRGLVLVVLRMALDHIRARHHHFGAHGLQVKDLLLAHLVGDDQQQPVALAGRDQGQPQARIAGGGFDQRGAGLDAPLALGRLDHVQPDAILDGTAGILVLQLQEQLAGTCIKAAGRDQRRIDRSATGHPVGPVKPWHPSPYSTTMSSILYARQACARAAASLI